MIVEMIGAFHEALNLASVWKLPVIFVCQNNRYAEHTAYAKGTSVERIADLKNFRQAGFFNVWLGIAPDDSPLVTLRLAI